MRKIKILLMAITVATFLAACNNSTKTDSATENGTDNTTNQQMAEKIMYQCPMHPEVISDEPGTCPKCQMDLAKITISGNDTIR